MNSRRIIRSGVADVPPAQPEQHVDESRREVEDAQHGEREAATRLACVCVCDVTCSERRAGGSTPSLKDLFLYVSFHRKIL